MTNEEVMLVLSVLIQFMMRRKIIRRLIARQSAICRKRRRYAAALRQRTAMLLILSMRRRSQIHRRKLTVRSVWMRNKSTVWWDVTVPSWDEKEWKENFRVDRATFSHLCDTLAPYMTRQNTTFRTCVSVEKRVAIALYTLASTAELRTIHNLFGVGKSTCCEIFHEFCELIVKYVMPTTIKFPTTASDIKVTVDGFLSTWNYPQCIGCIDGCHIGVSPPKEHCVDYHNFKGFYSVVLFAVCDFRYRFTFINVGAPGRNNDAHLFAKSPLARALKENPVFTSYELTVGHTDVPVHLVGDSAFALAPFMMKPYFDNGRLTEMQMHYNYRLSSTRRLIENCFGRLKARFRAVMKRMEFRIDNVNNIIMTACTLHNICEELGDAIDDNWLPNFDTPQQTQARSISTTATSENMRNVLAKYLYDEIR